jgi:Single-strand binding protein family
MTEASVSFAGNLTDDPELRHTESGIARAMFRVAATSRCWRRRPRRRIATAGGGIADRVSSSAARSRRACRSFIDKRLPVSWVEIGAEPAGEGGASTSQAGLDGP